MFGFLKNIFAGQEGGFQGEVVNDSATREVYAKDISIFKVVPEKVYYPKNTQDVAALVALCRKEKESNPTASLTVRAGGTCMSGGPLNSGWIIDMTKHMTSISVDPEAQTATVEMGAYFRDVEAAAAKHDLLFAAYPSSHLICGIGGMIGNNASGEKSLRNGATSDNIAELEVVLADGSVIRVLPKEMKRIEGRREKELAALYQKYGEKMQRAAGDVKKAASGYRLEKVIDEGVFSEIPLIVGSQGTLGIVTKAVLKLVPVPKHLSLLVISARTLRDLGSVIDTVRFYNPEGLETFDINTFRKAEEHLSGSAKKALPYLDAHAHLFILAQFSEDTEEATKERTARCFEELTLKGYYVKQVVDATDVAAVWDIRRHSFLLMRDYNPEGYKAVPCIEDVIVPVPVLGEFVESLGKILSERKLAYGFHGHIGDGSFRIVPVFDFTKATVVEDILGLMREVFTLVKRLRGNISADHSDGIIRTPFLKEFYGEELYGAFGEIKHLYDPENILNPKKKVDGDIAFLIQSIDK